MRSVRARDIVATSARILLLVPTSVLLLLLCTEISADAESGCEISAVRYIRDQLKDGLVAVKRPARGK